MLREYIGLALRAGLLDEDAKERFLITAKGRFYLENFEAIEKLLADKEEIRESISQ